MASITLQVYTRGLYSQTSVIGGERRLETVSSQGGVKKKRVVNVNGPKDQ